MTLEEYNRHLLDIAARNSTEPLYNTLRKGYSPGNVLFMSVALKRLPKIVTPAWKAMNATKEDCQRRVSMIEKEDELMKTKWPAAPGQPAETDDIERMLTRKIAEAYSNLRKTRNEFHKCTTQDQYARVSDDVQRVWEKEVQHAIARREHFRSTGQLDNEPSEGLPDNPVALSKHINSLRARISQAKKAGQTERIAALQLQLEAAGEKIKTMEDDA